MKCISKSITLLVSLGAGLAAAEGCVAVDGARIRAADLAAAVPAFGALPPDKDLAPAPAGTLVRVFHRSQLAILLPGIVAELPDRICVERKRTAIPEAAWQEAIDAAMTRLCPAIPWKATVLEIPNHRFPSGVLQFSRPGLVASRGSAPLWRGSLLLPDKSSIPVWVRVEVQTERRAAVLNHAIAAGTAISAEDYREEDLWVAGLCVEDTTPPKPEGMVARRALSAGASIQHGDLRRPPAIHRGQPVELEAGSGAARLRVSAVAENDAEVGEQVRLRSTWNGSKLVGRVTGAQKARVE